MFQKFLKGVEDVRAAAGHKVGKAARAGEIMTHAGYLGVVFLEAHGTYGLMAGVAAVALVIAAVIGGGGGEA